MSNHANYAKIGFTVVIGLVAIVAVLIYLGGAGHSDITYAETYYDTSVSGLSAAPDRAEEFVAKGLRATVTASGVTGLSRIELDLQRNRPPAPKVAWTPRHTYIPSYPSLLDNFSDSATKVMNEINRMDIASVWSNVSAAVDSAAHAAEGIRTVVDAARSSVDSVVGSVAEAAESLRDVTMELKRNPSLLIREREAAPLEETN